MTLDWSDSTLVLFQDLPLFISKDTKHLFSLGYILLETPESLLGSLKNVIILAHGKAEVVLCNVGVGIGVELRRGDGSHTDLMDEEPAELEVTRAISDMRREGVISWQLDGGHVGQHEIATFRLGVLDAR